MADPAGDRRSISAGADSFATTHWSLVLAAGRRGSPQSEAALATLCRDYWFPLYAYVRRTGQSANDAQDLTQAFFARLLEKNFLGDADRRRGKFRWFLLSAMKHFLANEWRRTRVRKRGGGRSLFSLDFSAGENRYGSEPADCLTAERLYDRQWALTLLDQALGRLGLEYADRGKSQVFAELKESLTGDSETRPYAESAATLGTSEAAVKMAVHRLRRRYGELLKEAVSQTVARPEDVVGELEELLTALRT
jgi:DNA-directed RNA polymerase specialized sigma24 family protein